ncbi:MAG: class I SAM-dependent methyltransferase [Pseudomonadota bacterium]
MQTPENGNPESRWFGDRAVSPDEKTDLVSGVFAGVAERYDLMNDLMSGGVHRLWKASFLAQVAPREGEKILDVAGGSGDIALAMAASSPVTICDLSPEMVAVAQRRAAKEGLADSVTVTVGNAEDLPIPSRSMDVYTIAFGLRNVTRIDKALAEARRVLRPGGRFFCLEFSRVVIPPLRTAYERYSDVVIPRLGRFVARDEESYRYLVESIRRFPSQRALAQRMEAAGMDRVGHRNMTGGIVAIHHGWRL